jgi:hypothetical protein
VRDVLAKVTIGEADAGIVYVSDAAAAGDDVQAIEIPDALSIVASYPIAAVTGAMRPSPTSDSSRSRNAAEWPRRSLLAAANRLVVLSQLRTKTAANSRVSLPL